VYAQVHTAHRHCRRTRYLREVGASTGACVREARGACHLHATGNAVAGAQVTLQRGTSSLGIATQSRVQRADACQHAVVPVPVDMPVISDGVTTLRPWVAGDVSFLMEASADPAIRRYSLSRSRPFTAVEAQAQLRDCESYWLTTDALGRPSGSLVIADAATGVALGQCGIDGWSSCEVAQIGYWLTPKARGRGIATRAVVQLTNWLFDLGASRVFLTVVEDNHASIRVAQRAGFLLEGATGKQTIWNGRCQEVLGFAVAAEDWKRRR
jgi:ribosomal-protein-alanine N-acetyltransferase